MKHWLTNEEMGEGFSHTEEEHKEDEYNSLINVCEHEKNITRTLYLIRDVWTDEQLEELRDRLNVYIENRKE